MKTLALVSPLALAVGALFASGIPASAERFDCSVFRGAQAQFACYENLSRAPAPQKEALKPDTVKPKAATRQRKNRAD